MQGDGGGEGGLALLGAWAATDTGSGSGSTDALSILMRGARAATDKGGSDLTDVFSILVVRATSGPDGGSGSTDTLSILMRARAPTDKGGSGCLLHFNGTGRIRPGRRLSWGWGSLLLHIVGGGYQGRGGRLDGGHCVLLLLGWQCRRHVFGDMSA